MIEYENLARLNEPFFREMKLSFGQTMEKGWYILGDNVKNFENEFAAYTGSRYCAGVASGLDALILALRNYELEPGSEVLVPSNTYIATILAILQNNLVPVLVEPDIRTYNIDPTQIESKITSRTKAVIVVHLYGKSCEMDPIVATCKKHNLLLIEDCAQSHGATYNNKMTGTFGNFGAFSFYPTKNLGALGDAGAITTDDSMLIEKIKKLRNYGSGIKYVNEYIGINSRLDEVQAGFLSVKLKHLDDINRHKRELAQHYSENLKDDFIKPVQQPGFFDVFHIYAVRHPERDRLREYLLKNGIKTEIHYPIAPYRQEATKGMFTRQEFPVSDEIHKTILSLPVSYFHTHDDVQQVIDVMNKF
jgi:dTDP-4-amino-4,6-dideoxygalactose transaminase